MAAIVEGAAVHGRKRERGEKSKKADAPLLVEALSSSLTKICLAFVDFPLFWSSRSMCTVIVQFLEE